MKYPWMQFYVKDWLSDFQLSICKPSTRGIYLDWLLQMHLNDRCGHVSGTIENLALIGRCSVPEAEAAIQDLKNTRAADVASHCDAMCGNVTPPVTPNVTVTNRRMKKEYKDRKGSALRMQKLRHKPESYDDVTPIATVHSQSQSQIHRGNRAPHIHGNGLENTSPDAPLLEKKEAWKLRKDLRESSDPSERMAIRAELDRRRQSATPKSDPAATALKPPSEPIPFEQRQALWEKAKADAVKAEVTPTTSILDTGEVPLS